MLPNERVAGPRSRSSVASSGHPPPSGRDSTRLAEPPDSSCVKPKKTHAIGSREPSSAASSAALRSHFGTRAPIRLRMIDAGVSHAALEPASSSPSRHQRAFASAAATGLLCIRSRGRAAEYESRLHGGERLRRKDTAIGLRLAQNVTNRAHTIPAEPIAFIHRSY